jgi:hypothetical protein
VVLRAADVNVDVGVVVRGGRSTLPTLSCAA